MANIKSAKKRIRVTAKQTMRNRMIKSRTKTVMRRVVEAVGAGDKNAAQNALLTAVKVIDKAASKGVYHKNNAARKKSKLAKMVNRVSA
ncbi:MAG: 30S ribosomal protein S20 [Defluviitaleaceae bacterium]|nr:30S ribosomal protein S20 [Defluviitaleaceae bacterium]